MSMFDADGIIHLNPNQQVVVSHSDDEFDLHTGAGYRPPVKYKITKPKSKPTVEKTKSVTYG